MKLKTLKDLKEKFYDMGVMCYTEPELKREVIKWAKKSNGKGFYCTICEKFNCDCGSSDCFKILNLEEAVKWIKHFFNITRGDLK